MILQFLERFPARNDLGLGAEIGIYQDDTLVASYRESHGWYTVGATPMSDVRSLTSVEVLTESAAIQAAVELVMADDLARSLKCALAALHRIAEKSHAVPELARTHALDALYSIEGAI